MNGSLPGSRVARGTAGWIVKEASQLRYELSSWWDRLSIRPVSGGDIACANRTSSVEEIQSSFSTRRL